MHEQEMAKQQTTEQPILIKTTGLSVEAKRMFDSIASRAYEIFESKGRVRGRDMENWLEAEAELFERTNLNVRESQEGVIVLADVRGFAPAELEVDLEPQRVTIIGTHQSAGEYRGDAGASREKRTTRLLRSVQLPAKIDARQATARLKKGILELDLKKAIAAKGAAEAAAGGNVH
jgi:HSP20 family molecular chaperone IbpA